MNTPDAAELARQRQQRLAAALAASDRTHGPAMSDLMLAQAGIQISRDPEGSPEARARNLAVAQGLRPDLAREVVASNGDPAITKAAMRAQELSATVPVVVVRGEYRGPEPVVQGEGLNAGAAKAYIHVQDPGPLDHQQVGSMVQSGQRTPNGATQMTQTQTAVDPRVIDNVRDGRAADARGGPDREPSGDQSVRDAAKGVTDVADALAGARNRHREGRRHHAPAFDGLG